MGWTVSRNVPSSLYCADSALRLRVQLLLCAPMSRIGVIFGLSTDFRTLTFPSWPGNIIGDGWLSLGTWIPKCTTLVSHTKSIEARNLTNSSDTWMDRD